MQGRRNFCTMPRPTSCSSINTGRRTASPHRTMKPQITAAFIVCLTGTIFLAGAGTRSVQTIPGAPAGWEAGSPREEIRPDFAYEPKGGADGKGCFVIRADGREGLDGYWTKTFEVTGGKAYRFAALFKSHGEILARRSIVAKLDWRDDQGQSVPLDEATVAGYLRGS